MLQADLAGKVAVVTGAGGAIGSAVADALGRSGAHVVSVDLSETQAEKTAARLTAGGLAASSVAVDVTALDETRAAFASIVYRLGTVDILANIAGIAGEGSPLSTMTDEQFHRVFDVNFKGTLNACQAVIPFMVEAKKGSIVNMSSVGVDLPWPGLGSYAISKAAVVMITRILAAELGPDNVRINAVAPSMVPSELSFTRHPDADGRREYEKTWAGRVPLNRVAYPDDVAAQVLYLASDDSGFVTGQTLRVNGGFATPW